MTSIRWQTPLVLLVIISFPAIILVMSRQFAATPELKAVDNNPQKFYLWATGREFSYCFTYDPHEADAWMFRTAEGKLNGNRQAEKGGAKNNGASRD